MSARIVPAIIDDHILPPVREQLFLDITRIGQDLRLRDAVAKGVIAIPAHWRRQSDRPGYRLVGSRMVHQNAQENSATCNRPKHYVPDGFHLGSVWLPADGLKENRDNQDRHDIDDLDHRIDCRTRGILVRIADGISCYARLMA